MNNQEYQNAIPHFCRCATSNEHVDNLLLCWGITHGLVQRRQYDVEGPHYCHNCEISFQSKRLEIKSFKFLKAKQLFYDWCNNELEE